MTLTIAVSVVAAVWLGALTVLVMASVRQIAIANVRIELMARGGAGVGASPTVGFAAPRDLVERFPFLGESQALVVVLAGSCGTCLRVLEEWQEGKGPKSIPQDDIIALITGRDSAEADRTAQVVSTLAGQVIREPASSQMAQALSLTYRPSAMLLRGGTVNGHVVLEHAGEIDGLVEGPETSPAVAELIDAAGGPLASQS